jgi:hypothetical protein
LPIRPGVCVRPVFNPPTQANTPARELARCFDLWVEASAGLPEAEKNHLLASAILGSPVPVRPARISAPPQALDAARSLLRSHAIGEGSYWAVCAGARPGLETKDWGEENWIAALSHIVVDTQAGLLFLGNEKESPSIERIRAGLPAGSKHVSLASPPPPIVATLGIIALSAGFVGRDSGPMQLAAACRRPILAIFGGSHWGRFFPDAQAAVIVSREVPCRGCLGYCHLPEPFCVRRVTVQQFLEGWSLLRTEAINGRRIVEGPLNDSLRREIAETAHLRFPELSHEARRHVFETGRAVNLLDSAGLALRSAARTTYRRKLRRHGTDAIPGMPSDSFGKA